MDSTGNAPSRLTLIRENRSPSARNCEAMLGMLNGKVQSLIDHVRQLEDRVEEMETGSGQVDGGIGPQQVIEAGILRIDHGARQVFIDDAEVPLSPTEYRLIHHLASNPGKVVLHRDLLRRASVHGEVNPGNLKVYIGRLRAKLSKASDARCDLKAVRGVGYRLAS